MASDQFFNQPPNQPPGGPPPLPSGLPPDEPSRPPRKPIGPAKPLDQVVSELGIYPVEAFHFVHQGLTYTANKLHGPTKGASKGGSAPRKKPGSQAIGPTAFQAISLSPELADELADEYENTGSAGDPPNDLLTDDPSRHISGAQLCEGLRELALLRWGMLARTVLQRWNIRATQDFGRIVFTLVDNGFMSKTDRDSAVDFQDIYDFAQAFDVGYRVGHEPQPPRKNDAADNAASGNPPPPSSPPSSPGSPP